MNKTIIVCSALMLFSGIACTAQTTTDTELPQDTTEMSENFKVQKSDAEWKSELTDEQYRVLREKGTERPYTGEYNLHFEDGLYTCAACNTALFESDSKFDGHCGWPSFDKPISEDRIIEHRDTSHGMIRTEIICATCGGHLGHVFNDGPTETGLRYCINSVSLGFDDEEESDASESKEETKAEE